MEQEQDPRNGAHPEGHELHVDAPVSLQALDAKLSLVISKVALLERDEETVFDRLDELRKGQLDIINGQRAILNTLTNEVLDLNKVMKTHVKSHPSKATRYLLAFTGGIAGGLAGGAVMTLLLKVALLSQHPAALSLVEFFGQP